MAAPAENLTFSEFQFGLAGGAGTPESIVGLSLSASVAPTAGTVGAVNNDIMEATNLGSAPAWNPSAGVVVTWDFGSERTIGSFRCAAYAAS